MPDKKQAAPTTKAARLKKAPKKIIALHYLMTRPLIQLEAAELWGETCLHSTISELYHVNGLEFDRVQHPHQHRHGGMAYFKRYTLKESSKTKAQALLDQYQMPESLK